MSVASREGLRARHEAYAGELAGQPGTWVRLTRSGNRWTGLIFDGEELLAVEPAAGLATSSRAPAASSLAFYRARDVEIPGSCALEARSSWPSSATPPSCRATQIRRELPLPC
jgi:hypothetical protein